MSAVNDREPVVSMPVPGQRRARRPGVEPRRLRLVTVAAPSVAAPSVAAPNVGAPDVAAPNVTAPRLAAFVAPEATPGRLGNAASHPGEVADDIARMRGGDACLEQSSVRLTPRGRLAAIAATLAAAAALVVSAYISAPRAPSRPITVTVHPGDTLWGLAAQVAPHRDPRLVVADLQHANGLHSTVLVPGQQLRVG